MLKLRQVALVAAQLAPVTDHLTTIFGLEVGYRDPGVGTFGLENAIFPIGNQFLEVVAPVKEGTAGGRYLERRGGDGGYMVICQAADHPPRRQRAQDLGIRTVLEFENDDYRCMQLHPADTGGSFLEIDWSPGFEQEDGPWEPAGHHWKDAVRTDRIGAIAAVEIQSDDPRRVAERWSEIVEIPLGTGDEGPTLSLDNAVIRFVTATDGRPEGLGGVDVRASDAGAVLSAASERGVPVDGQTVVVCGTRFRLV
jgi:hypothetical protein